MAWRGEGGVGDFPDGLFGLEFCVEVQRKHLVSGRCLGKKTLLDALEGNTYNGDKGENVDFKKN